jgi:O-antigen ligase
LTRKPLSAGSWRSAAALLATLLAAQLLGGGLRAEVSLSCSILFAGILCFSWSRATRPARFLGDPLFGIVEVAFVFLILAVMASAILAWAFGSIRGASLDPSATFVETLILLGLCCAFAESARLGSSTRRAMPALVGLLSIAAIIAIWSLAKYLLQHEERLTATYLSPNTAGTVFGACLVVTLNLLASQVRRERSARAFIPPVAAALLFALALLATASRGALVATTVGLVISLAPQLLRRSTGGRAQISVLAIATLALIIFAVAGKGVMQRFSSPTELDSRAAIFERSYQLFERSPINGFGMGAYDAVLRSSLEPADFARLWSIRSAHNVYLQWLVEAGVAGAILIFIVIGAIMLRTALTAARGGGRAAVLWGLIGADVVFLVHGLTDFTLQTPSVAALWTVMLGLQFGMANDRRPRGSRQGRGPAFGVAAFVVLASGAVLVSLTAGGGIPLGPVTIAPMAAGYDRAATKGLETARAPAALDRAETLSRKAIALSPYDTSAMLRLAYIDTLRHGRLTAEGAEQFALSYERAPLDQAVASWRIKFALESWSQLTPQTQAAVRREFEALVQTRSHRQILLDLLGDIRQGPGAYVAKFWLVRVQREPV